MSTTTKHLSRTLAVALVGLVAAVGLAQPASARQVAGSGPTGYVNPGTAICRYYDAWNRIDTTLPIPALYAPDRFVGAGNDAAWARYTPFVMDRYGNVERIGGTSGWGVAYDNRPVVFSGGSVTFSNIKEFSKPMLLVEWSGAGYTSSALIAYDRINLYTYGAGPFGNVDSCSKWRPF